MAAKNQIQAALSLVEKLHGPEAKPIVKYLQGKKNVSEFKIAEKTNTDINLARKVLYNLYHDSLVSYTKKKDKERGWTISFWTFNLSRAKSLMKILRRKHIEELKNALKEEQSAIFYSCSADNIRMKFDAAAENDFKCPECGSVLICEDNTEKIQKIKEELKKLSANK